MPKLRTLGPRVALAKLSIVRQQQRVAHQYDSNRGNSTQRGYGYRWQQASKGWLERNPLCVHCRANSRVTQATEVDHIIPHRGDMVIFWDRNNWQSLCKSCHSTKTAAGQ